MSFTQEALTNIFQEFGFKKAEFLYMDHGEIKITISGFGRLQSLKKMEVAMLRYGTPVFVKMKIIRKIFVFRLWTIEI